MGCTLVATALLAVLQVAAALRGRGLAAETRSHGASQGHLGKASYTDAGYPDSDPRLPPHAPGTGHRGYYDALCRGAATDYCRYVGDESSGSIWWSCALAGAPANLSRYTEHSAPGRFTPEELAQPCSRRRAANEAITPASLVVEHSGWGSTTTDFREPDGAGDITRVTVTYGSWIGGIVVAYANAGPVFAAGNTDPGLSVQSYALREGEYITRAGVQTGAFVDVLVIRTNLGVEKELGWRKQGLLLQDGTPSSCPMGQYKLAAIRGAHDGTNMVKLTFVWKRVSAKPVLPAPQPTAADAWWQCQRQGSSGMSGASSFLVRASPEVDPKSGQARPQCLATKDGTCVQYQGTCWSAQQACAADMANSSVKTCAATDFVDPGDWCPRAHGWLGLPPPPLPVPFNVTFVILKVCDQGYDLDVSSLEDLLYDGPQSFEKYIKGISGGRAVFSRNTSSIHKVSIPCNASVGSVASCDYQSWVRWVEQNSALSQLPEWSTRFGRHRAYVVPLASQCSWGGLSWGNAVLLRPGQMSSLRHELGHQLGLPHAGVLENGDFGYGDTSSPMGSCGWCAYNAPAMVELGWAGVLSTLRGETLMPGLVHTFDLPAMLDEHRSVLRVQADWLLPAVPVHDLYVSLRARSSAGSDTRLSEEELPDAFDRAVSVHVWNHKISLTQLLTTTPLKQGGVTNLREWSLVVRHSVSRLGRVSVCRYAKASSECQL